MQPEPKKTASAKTNVGPAITAETYNLILGTIIPIDVRTTRIDFEVQGATHGPLNTEAVLHTPTLEKGGQTEKHHYFDIAQRADFRVLSEQEETAAKGSAVFSVRVRVDFEPPQEFWDLFLPRNVRLYTHPPLRDLVASMVARAGLVARPIGTVSVLQRVEDSTPIGG